MRRLDSRLRLTMTAPHYHAHVDDPVAVGRRLKEARLAAGLSQRALSMPGCSSAYISRLEAGDRVPSLQLLRKLALKLRVDEEYLARGVARVEQTPAELVAAEVARRLGDFDLAREHYETVLEAMSAPAARERAARQLARLRGETLDDEQDERELVPGGLEDPAERARVLWQRSRELDDEGDRQGAARHARDALALLDYAEDRRLAGAETEIPTRDRELAGA
jgi:transcriptional regulator with XRE-family HTH domain